MGDTTAYSILAKEPPGKRPLGRLRGIWEDNIRIDIRETVWVSVEWMHVA
jgi:hypothetical protein